MLYLIRLGELTTKASKTRRRFMKILVHNIKDALTSNKIDFEIDAEWSRIFIRSENKKIEDILKEFLEYTPSHLLLNFLSQNWMKLLHLEYKFLKKR